MGAGAHQVVDPSGAQDHLFPTLIREDPGNPTVLTPIPVNAPPNTEFTGVLDTVGDRWRIVVKHP